MEVRFGLFDEVCFLNTATWRVEKGKVMKVTVLPTAVSKDSEGRDVLDDIAVLYELENRMVISEKEAFESEEELRAFLKERF